MDGAQLRKPREPGRASGPLNCTVPDSMLRFGGVQYMIPEAWSRSIETEVELQLMTWTWIILALNLDIPDWDLTHDKYFARQHPSAGLIGCYQCAVMCCKGMRLSQARGLTTVVCRALSAMCHPPNASKVDHITPFLRNGIDMDLDRGV